MLKPLVKWSGGKSDEIKLFKHHIPQSYDTYLEPFVGGGAVLFNLCPNKSAISDLHSELIDFYKSIAKGENKSIYDFMEHHPNNEETYYQVRDKFEPTTELENAMRFYYLRKTYYRGMIRYNSQGKFNIPYGRYKTYKYNELLNQTYTKVLANSDIYETDFSYLFENYNSNQNFMFLDPPYDTEFSKYGTFRGFDKSDHQRLFDYFKTTNIRCLMIIGHSNFIADLYQDYIVDKYNKKYRFKLHSDRIGDEINNSHLIIKNYY